MYNAYKYKRDLYLVEIVQNYLFIFSMDSLTSDSKEVKPRRFIINCENHEVDCNCTDFSVRKLPAARLDGVEPNYLNDKYLCKHLKIAKSYLVLIGVIK